MTEQSVIDPAAWAGLLESVGDDVDFMAELITTYFDDSPRLLAAMQGAFSAGNAEDLRRAAHSLKSSSANFGALRLSKKCKELEDIGKAGVLEGAAEQIGQIVAEYEKARAALEAIQRDGWNGEHPWPHSGGG
jgi:HPt (histidine-containing phosphotransfer) domain-containing protein